MLPRSRHEYLLRQLELHESVRASDIAEELGVSQVTVRRDIAELDTAGLLVRVHGGALALASASRKPAPARTLVGIIVPSSSAYYPEVVRGMETVASAVRVRLVLGVSSYDPGLERDRADRLIELGVRGLVIAPSIDRASPAEVASWLGSIPVPVVVLERHVDETPAVRELDCVRTDHRHGALLAMEHFARLGHQRVAMAIFDRTPTARWVRQGYLDAVQRLRLDRAPLVVLPKGEGDPTALRRSLAQVLDECLDSGTRAVVVHTDFHAARLIELAQDRGLKIPEDLAMIAYDDDFAEHASVPLTAVTAPRRELGREALKLLVNRVDGEDKDQPPRHVQLLPHLTVRDSCGARDRR